jgi:hypothetical protein
MSSIVALLTYLRERPRLLRGLFLGMLGLIVMYDFIAVRHGEHFVGDRIRTFWAMFAFGGTVFMTRFMKGIAAMFLAQPLDFYGSTAEEEE